MGQARRKLTMYEPAVFRIRIQGQLDECWSEYFGAQSVSVEANQAGNMITSITASVPISNSNRACAQEILAQEQAYLANLQMAASDTISGNSLTLTLADAQLGRHNYQRGSQGVRPRYFPGPIGQIEKIST